MGKVDEKKLWFYAALAVIIFLIVTTPGWQEVLGVNIQVKEFLPVIILFTFMFALLFVVLSTKKES